jgi:hypothetical protein
MADKYASMYSTADGPRLTNLSSRRSAYGIVPASGVGSSERRSFGASGTRRAFSNQRGSAGEGRNWVDEERINVLDKKIERARKENAIMKALYESDRVFSMANYSQKAGELNNRLASTYFKPLYMQQMNRSESVRSHNRRVDLSHSNLQNSRIRLETSKNKSRLEQNALHGENMFLPTQSYSAHKHTLKPASFVGAMTGDILNTSRRSKSANASKIRGKSSKSNKSAISGKKANKSTISKKTNKLGGSKKLGKSTLSKKSGASKPNKSTINKKRKAIKGDKSVLSMLTAKSKIPETSKILKSIMNKSGSKKDLTTSKPRPSVTSKKSAIAGAMNNKKAALLSSIGSGLGINSFISRKSKN